MKYTKEQIQEKLQTNDKWLERGLYAVWKFQTAEEKETGSVHYRNGVGFNGCDSEFLTSLGEQIHRKSSAGSNVNLFGFFLSQKQKIVARKKMIKYAGQLERIQEDRV